MSNESKPFNYGDSPDGSDVLQKFLHLIKPAALVAFATGTVDVMLYSHPKGYMQTLGRYLHVGWPILGATTAFVLTHNLVGSLRKEDDKLNWFLGGAAAGSIYGVWKKSTISGFTVAMVVGAAAVLKKDSYQNGYKLLPQAKTQYGGLWSCRQDWTLIKHRPGNWTTGNE